MKHEDFANGSNPANHSIADLTPKFVLIQPASHYTRVVLVLDVSGSMRGSRIKILRQVMTLLIF